jgi:sortase A
MRLELNNEFDKTPNTESNQTVKKQKPKRRVKMFLLLLFAILLLALSIYILVLMFLPKLQKQSPEEVQNTVEQAIKNDKDMVLIPTAGISAEIAEGDANILDKGLVWHRFPERGDPTKGGNTIFTGHSFVWGYTPQQIKEQSIFYNLNEVKEGDDVTVVWDKKTYQYTVTDIKEVKPNAIDIENKTADSILTIYTCTKGGAADGRVVVIAKPK